MTCTGLHLPQSPEEFATCWARVTSVVDPSSRLPQSPFVAPGVTDIAQYERLLGTDFVPVLDALAELHGDDDITLVTVEPDPAYYREHYSHFPALRVQRSALAECFWEGLAFEPLGDPTGSVAYTADVVAVAGSTGAWAVWGQRDWDLVLVHSAAASRPWLDVGVPFASAREALRDFTTPSRGGAPVPDGEAATFAANLKPPGTGT
jgi:hypothetical protein